MKIFDFHVCNFSFNCFQSENRGEKLRNNDRDISEYKQKIELLESEKEKLARESEKTKDNSKK